VEAESLVNGVMFGRTIAVLALVIGIILLLSWFLRRQGMGIGFTKSNGKFKRLSVLEIRPIDNQRRLVLIERDSAQHLILIGGQNDLVIETNIRHKQEIETDPSDRVRFRDALAETTEKAAQGAAPVLQPGQRITPTEEDAS